MNDNFRPLGDYEQLRDWSGHAMQWGAEGTWSATFGGGVVDQLVELIEGFPDRVRDRYPLKAEAWSLALGCVPWLTSFRVADALLGLSNQCICVDKSGVMSDAVQKLLAEGNGAAQEWMPGLEFMAPLGADGEVPIVHPFGPSPGHRVLEPVRVVGWTRRGRRRGPLLHAKLAVLCAGWTWENEVGWEQTHLTPMAVWVGSANWTSASAAHVEFGAWSTDEALCDYAMHFLIDLIRFSEPPTSTTAGPTPDLVSAEWDDEAFAEYAAELYEGREDDTEPWCL